MRLSTVFISSTFVLAGMSAAFPVETEDMLIARFADSDFLSEVEARAYDEEPELYVHGGYKTLSRHRRSLYESSPASDELTRRDSPGDSRNDQRRVTFAPDTKGPTSRPASLKSLEPQSSRSGFCTSMSKMLNRRPRIPGSNFFKSGFRDRRSFDEPPRSELARRHDRDPHRPETPPRPPRRVSWSSDTVDTPDRPRRPPTPSPHSPGNGNGNGNGHSYHYHHRSFFDLD